MRREDKLRKIYFDCLEELYQNSEPSVSFYWLMENSPLNDLGGRVIPYDKHLIDRDLSEAIIEKYLKKVKGYDKKIMKFNLYLGCAPSYKPKTI